MATFHYALNENGILLLGKSETAGNSSEFFTVKGKQERTYQRKAFSGRTRGIIPVRTRSDFAPVATHVAVRKNRQEDFETSAEAVFLSRYVPAAVIVNEEFEIVQFKGDTTPYLALPPGKANFNVLKMAREGLSFEIRSSLHKAREQAETVVKEGVLLTRTRQTLTLEVTPLLNTVAPYFLVVFRQLEAPRKSQYSLQEVGGENEDAGNQQIVQLERELAQLREDMRIITEEQEEANEELQAGNEELLSGNEELQSLNEELETSKEELQSTNEELMTVSQELYDRNEQYNLSRLYAEAIVKTIREPLLIINKDLRVRSANPAFYEAFGLTEKETEGNILFQLQNGAWNIPELRTLLSKIQTGDLPQSEWQAGFSFPGEKTRLFLLKVQPVQPENSTPSILLAFEDITLRVQESERLRLESTEIKEGLEHEVKDLVEERDKGQAHAEFLETTVAERTLQLQQANSTLEHTNRNLQGFASIAAHNLQEPLRKIRTFAAMLQKLLPDATDASVSLLDKIEKSAARMATLIKDVLNFSRLSQEGMSVGPVDLEQVADNVLNDFELVIGERNAIITIENRLPVIEAVAPQMNQLFYNLLSNSLKFVSETESPRISISAEEITGTKLADYPALRPSDRYTKIVFSDNGIGFDPEYAEQIFAIFERLSSSYEGTGIGLALCRQIVEQHGGIIRAGHKETAGSDFIILLPYSQQQA